MKAFRLVLCLAALLAMFALAGCGDDTPKTTGPEIVDNNPMSYFNNEDLKKAVVNGDTEILILDMRKAADYSKKHVAGSFSADMDKAKDGDNASGLENMKAALKKATGSETGNADQKIVLLCYSGKRYAQKGTDVLINLGVPAANILTLEGGYGGMEGAEFETIMVTGDEPGEVTK